FLFLLVTILILVALKRLLNKIQIFHPLVGFPLAFFVFFILGTIDLIPDPGIWGFTLFKPMGVKIFTIWSVGLISYLIFYGLFCLMFSKKFNQSSQNQIKDTFRTSNIYTISIILFAMGNVVYLYTISKFGIPILSLNVSEVRVTATSNGILTTILLSSFWVASFLLFAMFLDEATTKAKKTVILSLIFVMFLEMYSLGNRGFIFQPGLVMMFMYYFIKKKIDFHKLMIAGMVMFVLFGYLGLQRNISQFGEAYKLQLIQWGFKEELLWIVPSYMYIRAPISTLRDVMEVIPFQINYQNGKQFFSPFLSLLPGSHESSDFFFKRILGHDFIGFGEPATLIGVFYSDLGIIGIIFGMAFIAFISFITYKNMEVKKTVESKIYYAYLLQVSFMSLYGSFFAYIITLWIPILIGLCFLAGGLLSRKKVNSL
ncbi:O-antigen polymerase, partial [Neobacillus drentensis]|uniref:O-antigen polymerase n=1 Tax=Neobacillus drentensis TaxID=220684 RepID=UPI002FFEF1F7